MEAEFEDVKGLTIETARGMGEMTAAQRFFEDIAVALKLRCDALEASVAELREQLVAIKTQVESQGTK